MKKEQREANKAIINNAFNNWDLPYDRRFNMCYEQILIVVNWTLKNRYIKGMEQEDLVQEVIMHIYKRMQEYTPKTKVTPNTLVFKMAKYGFFHLIQWHKTNKRCIDREISTETPIGEDSGTIGDILVGREAMIEDKRIGIKELLEECYTLLLGELSTLESKVLEMYARGEPYDTITEALSIKPKAVDNALCRIRERAKIIKEIKMQEEAQEIEDIIAGNLH